MSKLPKRVSLDEQIESLNKKIKRLEKKNKDLLEQGRGKTTEERRPLKIKIKKNKSKILEMIAERVGLKKRQASKLALRRRGKIQII